MWFTLLIYECIFWCMSPGLETTVMSWVETLRWKFFTGLSCAAGDVFRWRHGRGHCMVVQSRQAALCPYYIFFSAIIYTTLTLFMCKITLLLRSEWFNCLECVSASTKAIFVQGRVALIKTKSLERLQPFKDLPRQSLAPASSAQTAICVLSPPSEQNKTHAARIKHRSFTAATAMIVCLADEAETMVEFIIWKAAPWKDPPDHFSVR